MLNNNLKEGKKRHTSKENITSDLKNKFAAMWLDIIIFRIIYKFDVTYFTECRYLLKENIVICPGDCFSTFPDSELQSNTAYSPYLTNCLYIISW